VFVFDPNASRSITDEGGLVREQRFDLSIERSRTALNAAAHDACRTHARTLNAMTKFFLENCKIEALAYPSSA